MNAKKLSIVLLAALMVLCVGTISAFAAVANINGADEYDTLEAAFTAAQDGDTINVLSDCNGNGIQVPVGKFPTGLTVDFGGNTYTVDGTLVGSTNTANQCFQLLKDNTITFKNGTITVDNSSVSWTNKNGITSYGAAMIIQNYSNLTLDNMTIDGSGASVDYTVSNNNGATTIKDSTIESHDGGVAFDVWYGLSSTYPSVSVTVIDSNINGDVEVGSAKATGFEGNLALSIEGDTAIDGAINNSSNATVQAAMEASAEDFVAVDDTVTVTGASEFVAGVASINGKGYATLQEAFAAAQDGDTINVIADCNGDGIIVPQGKFQPQGLTVDFGGYTFDMDGTTVGSAGTETLAFQLLKDNNLTFKNGTITTSTNSCKMILQNYSNLTLDNMNIDGTHSTVLYAVSNNNGETLIKDSVVTANDNGVAFDVWYGMAATYPSVSVTVENSTINGDVEVGAAKNANMANIDTNMGLTITDSEINGDINNSSAAINKDAVELAAAEIITIDENTTIAGDNNMAPYVAKIGDTKYASLQEAFAAAQDGDTITLYADCNGDGIIVPQGKFQPAGLTVDFNGKTFDMDGTTVGSAGTETLAFQLLKDNNLTFKNGTITSSTPSCKMILQNYSNLTLDNMNIDGTYPTVLYAVSNNNGETLIKDSTVTANDNGVAFDVWYGMSTAYPSVAVTVQNSTINGDVEYGAHKNANMANVETNMGLTITDSEIHGDIKNSSAAVNKDAVAAAAEETLVIEDTVVDGQNVFSVAKTLLVYNMDMVDGQYQIALFAGVDALEYQNAGFEVTQNGETTVYTTRWVSTSVSVNGEVKEADAFGAGAQYVFGQIINLDSDAEVSIRAFVTDYAGNTTYNKTIGVPDIYTLN